jgi:hypothetical protein
MAGELVIVERLIAQGCVYMLCGCSAVCVYTMGVAVYSILSVMVTLTGAALCTQALHCRFYLW